MTFAVQWPDPVSGHPASKIRDTEAEAEAERRRLELTGLRHVVVVEFEPEARQPHGNAALSPEQPATAPEGQHEDGKP